MIKFLQLTPFVSITFALLLGVLGGIWGLLTSLLLLIIPVRGAKVLIVVVAAGVIIKFLAPDDGYKPYFLDKSSSTISLYALETKGYIENSIDSMDIGRADRGVLKAILIGDKSDIKSSTRTTYANCGVAHMLAISGFHIGVICLILNLLLFKLKDIKLLNYLKTALIITILWFYALMTGFSPSVVRAVIMFSMFQISSLFITSRYHAYNILAFTFTAMMVIDANVVYSIGFQLSFMAMSAIIIFSEAINRVVVNKYKVVRYILGTMLLSAIISLFTAPLTLYYFGQASIIGIISNVAASLLIFPLYGCALIAIVFNSACAVSAINTIFNILNYLLEQFSTLDSLYFTDMKFEIVDLALSYVAIVIAVVLYFRLVDENIEKKRKFAELKSKKHIL